MGKTNNNEAKSEIVYIMINEAMPGYVKIGKTNDLERRIRELDKNVPLPFKCFYACTVEDMNSVEKYVHDIFLDSRTRSNREFFRVEPKRVRSALKLVELEDITPPSDIVDNEEDQRALDKARKRRAVFNFGMVDIPAGAELSFLQDPSKKVKVLDNRWVEYEGSPPTSLSAVAQKLLESKTPVSGPLYWKYEGEILDDRRTRFESQE